MEVIIHRIRHYLSYLFKTFHVYGHASPHPSLASPHDPHCSLLFQTNINPVMNAVKKLPCIVWRLSFIVPGIFYLSYTIIFIYMVNLQLIPPPHAPHSSPLLQHNTTQITFSIMIKQKIYTSRWLEAHVITFWGIRFSSSLNVEQINWNEPAYRFKSCSPVLSPERLRGTVVRMSSWSGFESRHP